MRPDDGRIDHLHAVRYVFGVARGFKEQFPDACERPAPELAVDRGPFPETVRQVAPLRAGAGAPEDAVQDEAMVTGRTTPLGSVFDQERLEERPIVVAHQVADQDALLNSAS